MAVSAKMFSYFPKLTASGAMTVPGSAVKVALFTNLIPINQDKRGPYMSGTPFTSNQSTGAGYSAGGSRIGNVYTYVNATTNVWMLDGDDVTWSSCSASARYAVVYASSKLKPCIAYVDFGASQNPAGGNFTIQWASGGIVAATIG